MKLTPRQQQVLQLTTDGKEGKIIAEELGMSLRTVDHHRGKLLRLFQVPHVMRLISLHAERRGWQKAHAMAQQLVEQHAGGVPDDLHPLAPLLADLRAAGAVEP